MFDFVYRFLNGIGYSHPIHPTQVHIPIGLVIGALVFALFALIFRRKNLRLTPWYCLILAFIWVFPTILFGIMDWQYFYNGAWLFPIKIKLVVAPLLVVLLIAALFLGHKYGPVSRAALLFYFLCACSVIILGYFGGQLVFGSGAPGNDRQLEAGQKVFTAYCSACHPQGTNVIRPDLPLKGSLRLKDFETMLSFIRHPEMPDGSKGVMPAFQASKVPDKEAKALYEYIIHALK